MKDQRQKYYDWQDDIFANGAPLSRTLREKYRSYGLDRPMTKRQSRKYKDYIKKYKGSIF